MLQCSVIWWADFTCPYYFLTFTVSTTAAKTIGVNPKINNMNQGYKAAKYDLLWICDSNIRGKVKFEFIQIMLQII